MADPMDAAPGRDAALTGYATATKSLQSFAAEMQRMSKDAMDHTAQLMEKLRGARTMEEIVAVQTAFIQQSFASYADCTRTLGALMMTLPMELAKQNSTAFQQGSDRVTKAADEVGEQVRQAGETLERHVG